MIKYYTNTNYKLRIELKMGESTAVSEYGTLNALRNLEILVMLSDTVVMPEMPMFANYLIH